VQVGNRIAGVDSNVVEPMERSGVMTAGHYSLCWTATFARGFLLLFSPRGKGRFSPQGGKITPRLLPVQAGGRLLYKLTCTELHRADRGEVNRSGTEDSRTELEGEQLQGEVCTMTAGRLRRSIANQYQPHSF
jgi:hypothetical protein